ncbi:uncharacterized protein EV420DRAFT_353489, partial [Desarmillaria tabescens]
MRSPKYNIFALIIGVDKYESLEYENLNGVSSDANRFEAYLLEDLQTPKANIISFRDGQVTRSAIIDELTKMKYNSNIQPDTTAIIIYFAGYGATTIKPVEWIDWETPYNQIGMLCPTDIGILDKNGNVINGIPDRTINQLLLELSSVKGNNITLILDCSHINCSSDQQKPADMPTAESSHLDLHILLTTYNRFGRFAYKLRGEGLFTHALLKVLRERSINELTYKSLAQCLYISI